VLTFDPIFKTKYEYVSKCDPDNEPKLSFILIVVQSTHKR